MNINGTNFLGVIDAAEQVGTIRGAKIFKITNAKLVCFRVSFAKI